MKKINRKENTVMLATMMRTELNIVKTNLVPDYANLGFNFGTHFDADLRIKREEYAYIGKPREHTVYLIE